MYRKKTVDRLTQEEYNRWADTNIIVYAPTGETVFESTLKAAHETVGGPGNARTVATFADGHRLFVARPLDDVTMRAQAKAVHPAGKNRG